MSESYSVKECLRGYTNSALDEICSYYQLAAGTKANRMKALEKMLCDSLHTRRALGDVQPSGIRLLHLVARRGQMCAADMARVPGLYCQRGALETIEDLARKGLLLTVPDTVAGTFAFPQLASAITNGGHPPHLCVPDAVATQLPPPPALGVTLPPAAEAAKAPTAEQADTATSAFLETLRITEVLSPRVIAAGQLHKTDKAKALEMARAAGLSGESFGLSLAMAYELGCVATKAGRLTTTSKADRWAEGTRAQRVRDLFQAYVASEELPDLRLFFPDIFETMEEHLPRGSARRTYHKALVARILAEQQPGTWYSLAAFVETIRRADENVLFLDERWRAIRSNSHEMTPAWQQMSWKAHEARLFSWLIHTFLFNMNMVVVSEDGTTFSLTPIGCYALGTGPAPEGANGTCHDALIVQPDFEVVAYLDRCPPDLRRKLDVFCERVSGGMVTTYRLTGESVYRGVRSGLTINRFVELLKDTAAKAIPSNVLEQFETWRRKLESVTVRSSANLLEFKDAAQARKAAEGNPGSRLIGERFVLLNGSVPSGTKDIDYSLPQRPLLRQEKGLQLSAPWEESNLFLKRRLADLGEIVSDGAGDLVVRLTRQRIRDEEDSALVMAQLDGLVLQPLAGRYRLALRGWAGDIGGVRTKNATLVRFDDANACEAALDLPELAKHVEGRLGLFTLVIRQGQLTEFKKRLKEHGIAVGKSDDIVDDTPPEEWTARWLESRQAHEEVEEAPEPKKQGKSADEPADDAMLLPSYPPRIIREILEDAIDRRQPVLIAYQSAYSPEPSVRRVNPVSVNFTGDSPSLSGYCHQHGGARDFRLSRITGIRVLEDETF